MQEDSTESVAAMDFCCLCMHNGVDCKVRQQQQVNKVTVPDMVGRGCCFHHCVCSTCAETEGINTKKWIRIWEERGKNLFVYVCSLSLLHCSYLSLRSKEDAVLRCSWMRSTSRNHYLHDSKHESRRKICFYCRAPSNAFALWFITLNCTVQVQQLFNNRLTIILTINNNYLDESIIEYLYRSAKLLGFQSGNR